MSAVKSWSTLRRVAERDERDQVGGLHFRFKKVACGLDAAIQVLGLHRGEVEEHDDEAMIAQIFGLRYDDSLVARTVRACREAADGGFVERSGHVDALEVEGGNLLLLAVLVDGEVALLEAVNEFAGLFVADHDIGEHEFGVYFHDEAARLLGILRRGASRGRRALRERGAGYRHSESPCRCECEYPLRATFHQYPSGKSEPYLEPETRIELE